MQLRTGILVAGFLALAGLTRTSGVAAETETGNMCDEWEEMVPGMGYKTVHGFQITGGACYQGVPQAKHSTMNPRLGYCHQEHDVCPS